MQSALIRHSTVSTAALLFAAAGTLFAAKPVHAQSFAPLADRYAEWHAADSTRWQHDRSAPVIAEVTPQQGEAVSERGETRISARFWDQGTGIASVTMRVDGRDMSRFARIDRNEIRVRKDLAPGRHFAEVFVRDRAGNVSRRAWSFEVIPSHRDHREYGYNGPAGLQRW